MEAVLIPFSAERSRSLKPQPFSPATVHGGLLNFPPPVVTFYSNCHRHHQQPALLPSPRRPFPPPSCRPKGKKSRDQSLTPKKSKSIKRSRDAPAVKSAVETTAEFVIIDSTNRLGPEPSHVPNDLWRNLGLRSSAPPQEGSQSLRTTVEIEFSGSAFSVSPPPSSVPLPKFSLRRKLSCNMEGAAGVDAGATDNLRRLLRI